MESRIIFLLWGCSFIFLLVYALGVWIQDRLCLSQCSEQRKRAFLWLEVFHSMEEAVSPHPSSEEVHWALEQYWEENKFIFLCKKKLKNCDETTFRSMKNIGEQLALRINERRNSDTWD